ncbi:MAG TPA: maleylpyruvate isomerase N-terminal domain-containing protein [Dehalococcoidia bacterium]|nr:maleylpyruvate isomerase N-terminal domain-containing protein [Dehalococcoidia bacterium]
MAQEDLGPGVKADLLRRMDEGFGVLTAALAGAPGLRPAPEGGWGPFEVVSHLNGWHLLSARRLLQIARGEGASSPPSDDEANACFVADRRHLSADALLAELESSFATLKDAVASVPAREFWLGLHGELDSLAHFIAAANSYEHYAEHLGDLKTP